MQLILFDFDGVLADTFSDMIQFAQETCDELGVNHTVKSADLSNLEVMSFATFGKAGTKTARPYTLNLNV